MRAFAANHNHRPCRWFAPAPFGSFANRAYRLIELPFPYMSCLTTTNVVCSFSWPPLKRESEAQSAVVNDSPVDCQSRRPGSPQRAGFCEVKDWGREYFLFFFLSLRLRLRRIHLPHQREANRCGGTRHSESFLEPPDTQLVVFFIQKLRADMGPPAWFCRINRRQFRRWWYRSPHDRSGR